MFQRLDLVKLSNGDQLIITADPNPRRPANPYLGVKLRGNGAQYKFGPKHNPVKIGTVEESHPAIQALNERNGVGPTIDGDTMVRVRDLVRQFDTGNEHDLLIAARLLVPYLRKFV